MKAAKEFRSRLSDKLMGIGATIFTTVTVGTTLASGWRFVLLGFLLVLAFWSLSYLLLKFDDEVIS